MDEYAYDVFISYSSKDQTWVHDELLPRLEQAGLKVCIDFRDFEVGEPSISAMERAVHTSRKTLLVLTPAYLSSAWTEFEHLMLQWLDPANRQRRLIPLVREQCELPPRIGYLIHLDFRAPNEQDWRRLFNALKAPWPLRSELFPAQPDHRLRPLLPSLSVYLIGIVLSLVSTLLSSFLVPSFAQQRGFALLLFLLTCALGLWLTLSQASEQSRFGARRKAGQPLPALWRWTLTGLVVPLAVGVWLLTGLLGNGATQQASCPPDQVCVLISAIAPAGNTTAATVTQYLEQQIQRVLDQLPTTQSMILRGAATQDSKVAVEQARQAGAILVVWGQVLETESEQLLRVEFHVVDRLGIGESPNVRWLRAEPLNYDPMDQVAECFQACLQFTATKAQQHTSVIAYTVAGLVDYVQDRPEQARESFIVALHCAGETVNRQVVQNVQPDCTPDRPVAGWNPGLLHYYLGKTLILQGSYPEGIEQLKKATEFNEHDPAAWIGLGTAYQGWLAQIDASEAVKVFDEGELRAKALLAGLQPAEWGPIYHNLGLIRALRGDHAGAISYFTQAVEHFDVSQSSAYTSLVNLGHSLREAGKLTEAVEKLNAAINLEAESPWAYLERALAQQTNLEQAEADIQAARERAPQEAYVEVTQAEFCLSARGEAGRTCAAEAYTRALTKRPNSGWLHSLVGVFYLPTNPVQPGQSWEIARDRFAEAATLRPNDPWAHERLAYVLHNLGDYTGAADHYQRAIELAYPEPAAAAGFYCNLGRAQQLGEQKVEAEQSYQQCAKLATTPELRSHAEQLLEALKQ